MATTIKSYQEYGFNTADKFKKIFEQGYVLYEFFSMNGDDPARLRSILNAPLLQPPAQNDWLASPAGLDVHRAGFLELSDVAQYLSFLGYKKMLLKRDGLDLHDPSSEAYKGFFARHANAAQREVAATALMGPVGALEQHFDEFYRVASLISPIHAEMGVALEPLLEKELAPIRDFTQNFLSAHPKVIAVCELHEIDLTNEEAQRLHAKRMYEFSLNPVLSEKEEGLATAFRGSFPDSYAVLTEKYGGDELKTQRHIVYMNNYLPENTNLQEELNSEVLGALADHFNGFNQLLGPSIEQYKDTVTSVLNTHRDTLISSCQGHDFSAEDLNKQEPIELLNSAMQNVSRLSKEIQSAHSDIQTTRYKLKEAQPAFYPNPITPEESREIYLKAGCSATEQMLSSSMGLSNSAPSDAEIKAQFAAARAALKIEPTGAPVQIKGQEILTSTDQMSAASAAETVDEPVVPKSPSA